MVGGLARSPSRLELTMAMPGLSSSSSVSGDSGGVVVRDLVLLDMNQPAASEGDEEYPMGSMEEADEEIIDGGGTGSGGGQQYSQPKKLRLTKEQSRLLEESFRHNHTLNPKQKEALATRLKLKARQVEVWFQNRRARTKLKQTEMECEYLKRCFGSLTEENRRLQREVEELRALRVAPPTMLSPHTRQPMPASSLTMCPRCERVTAASSGTPAVAVQQRNRSGSSSMTFAGGATSAFHPRRPSAAC